MMKSLSLSIFSASFCFLEPLSSGTAAKAYVLSGFRSSIPTSASGSYRSSLFFSPLFSSFVQLPMFQMCSFVPCSFFFAFSSVASVRKFLPFSIWERLLIASLSDFSSFRRVSVSAVPVSCLSFWVFLL